MFASSGLADGVVLAIATSALVSAIDAPQFDVSSNALIHQENTSPLAIGTAGSPATVAAPSRSAFQTDTLILRLRMDVSWGVRSAGSVAWLTGATW